MKYNKLKVLNTVKIKGRIYFNCICECGIKKVIYSNSVTSGHTQSCGCLHSKLSSNRMKKNNPMFKKETRDKMSNTLKYIGHKPRIQGGNGKEMPVSQRVLLVALGKGWYAEHVVLTKGIMDSPYNYKIDIANPKKMIAIEVDGRSHCLLKRQEQDRKKEKILKKLGWIVLRFKNEEVMSNLDLVIKNIHATTTTSAKVSKYKSQ